MNAYGMCLYGKLIRDDWSADLLSSLCIYVSVCVCVYGEKRHTETPLLRVNDGMSVVHVPYM